MSIFDPSKCVVFNKTKDKWGGMSNMCAGFPVVVKGVKIRTSEALYQACRFPHLPDWQQVIIDEKSPISAKMKSRSRHEESRSDWDDIRVEVMRWCLRIKLLHNWKTFSNLLEETGDLPIVELSKRDPFWGAIPQDNGFLIGDNQLGHLLVGLRNELRNCQGRKFVVDVPNISNFTLLGEPIISQESM